MALESIKLDIIQWITNLQDEKLLKTLLSFKKAAEDTDWWEGLTQDQKNSIEEGLKDLQQGNHISNREFWSRYGRQV